MAAGVITQAPSFTAGGSKDTFGSGPGYISPLSYTSSIPTSGLPNNRIPGCSSAKAVSDADRAGSLPASSKSVNKQNKLRPTLRNIDTKMSARTLTDTTNRPFSKRSDSLHDTSLHKRASSASSLPRSPSAAAQAQLYSTQEEPFPDISPIVSNSTPKIKPYLRKISAGKDNPKEDLEQGRVDLSKSVSENVGLAGLGIQDFGVRSASDGVQSSRSFAHTRNTSVGSQLSTNSTSFRPNQPFIHPARPTPTQPYTPPPDTSSLNDEEAHESSDVVTDDNIQPISALRGGRSMSLSSTPQLPSVPTTLSQTYTAADLGYVPKLTNNASQTNLSIKSMKSSKSKLGRPRAETNRSVEFIPSASSRTSLDRAVSFISRRSDPDPAGRDERIRAARRKFEEKEANKDRKLESQAFKRRESELAKDAKKQERQRRKSEASDKPRIPKASRSRAKSLRGAGGERKRSNELQARSYDESRITALPTHGDEPGKSEATARITEWKPASRWTRFSVWLRTRILSCGGKGR